MSTGTVWRPAASPSAVEMLSVRAETTAPGVTVLQATEETPTLSAPSLSVWWTRNVRRFWPVEMSTVWTRVTVLSMLSA